MSTTIARQRSLPPFPIDRRQILASTRMLRQLRIELELTAAISALEAMEVPFSLTDLAKALAPASLDAAVVARGTGHTAVEYILHGSSAEFRSGLAVFVADKGTDERISARYARACAEGKQGEVVGALARAFLSLEWPLRA